MDILSNNLNANILCALSELGVAVVFLKPCFNLSIFKYCVKLLLKMAPTNTEKTKLLTFCIIESLVTRGTFLGHASEIKYATLNIIYSNKNYSVKIYLECHSIMSKIYIPEQLDLNKINKLPGK